MASTQNLCAILSCSNLPRFANVQAMQNGLSRRQRCSSFLLLQFDQGPQAATGKSEF
jgi:hypothetical protein